VQRNIVAEQVLGLPREPDVEHGMAWNETRTRKAEPPARKAELRATKETP
jgi:hypothetical protein